MQTLNLFHINRNQKENILTRRRSEVCENRVGAAFLRSVWGFAKVKRAHTHTHTHFEQAKIYVVSTWSWKFIISLKETLFSQDTFRNFVNKFFHRLFSWWLLLFRALRFRHGKLFSIPLVKNETNFSLFRVDTEAKGRFRVLLLSPKR